MAQVTFAGNAYPMQHGESVLECLERHGRLIPASCRSGVCQSCLMKVLSGAIPPKSQEGLRPSWKAEGYFLACTCHPEEDVTVCMTDAANASVDARIESIAPLNARTLRIRVKPDAPVAYRAGQFFNLDRGDGAIRSYSAASVPELENFLEFHVGLMPGGAMSGWFHNEAQPGSALHVRGPLGTCFYTGGNPDRPLLLAGTGTGLAPLYGVLRDALRQGHTGEIHVLHGALRPEGLYLVEELRALAAQHAQLRYHPCVLEEAGETGMHQGDLKAYLKQQFPALGGWGVWLCGDPALVRQLQRQCFLNGASLQDILADAFLPAAAPAAVRPLSPAQEGMLYLSLTGAEPGAYVEQIAVQIREPLLVPHLLRCWQAALRHHPILRTAFCWKNLPEPCQTAARDAVLPWAEEDWRDRPAAGQRACLDAFLAADRATPFDLSRPPLMRLALIRLADDEYQLIWTVHHLLVDGRSIRLLLHQVFGACEAAASGLPFTPPAAPPFEAYLDWLPRQPSAQAEVFWRQHLAGFHAPTTVPLPPPALTAGTPRHNAAQRRLDARLSAALEAFAQQEGLTLNILLLGAWALLLHRYSGSDDAVLGATKSVRQCPAAGPDSLGVYINTLPVRTRLDSETPAIPWLRALREQWLRLRAFEHSAPGMIRRCSEIPGGTALYEVYFVFDHHRLGEALRALGGPWAARDVALYERTPLPLMLAAYGGESIELNIEYDATRFGAGAIERMLGHLQTLLEQFLANPQAPLGALPLLRPEERHQILDTWQPPAIPRPHECLHHGLERAAAATPGATAVRCGDRALTYGELNRRANHLAHQLRERGVAPEDRAGLCMPRGIDALAALLAILKAGATYVPIDPAYPEERIERMVAGAQLAVLLTGGADALQTFHAKVPLFHPDGTPDPAHTAPGDAPAPPADPAHLAYIIYTSGSTGEPKGVCVRHSEAAAHCATMREYYALVPGDRVLQFASLSFDVSLEQIFTTFHAGATLVIADPATCMPAGFAAFLHSEGITVANLPPAFWRQWTEEGLANGAAHCGPQFRLLILGGDVAPLETLKLWQCCPATAPVRLVNAYGPTETVITATLFEIPPGFGTNNGPARVPIGRPLPGTAACILDGRNNLVPVGVPGELLLGGNRLARGYLNRPMLTAQRFIPHPFSTERGALLYRTGDLARFLEDGQIEFLGRIDDQVKIRGFRIELGEIESILREHPGVSGAVVRCRKERGGEHHLVAYIVPNQTGATIRELRCHLRSRLPGYMIPAAFMFLDAFPISVSGKIDYPALPAPDESAFAAAADARVEPRTELERLIAKIWRQVLHIEHVGVRDNFFDLGGHSLRAAQVITRLRGALHVDVPLGALFLQPTIEGFAQTIEAAGAPKDAAKPSTDLHDDPCLVVLRKTDRGSPLFCALGAGGAAYSYSALASHLDPGQPVYGLQYSHLPNAPQYTTVESIAARYLHAVRQVQPHGPYRIAGWSFGGIVAYEMAQQLHREGEPIALLALIDCEAHRAPGHAPHQIAGTLQRKLHNLWRKLLILVETRETVWTYARDLTRIAGKSLTGAQTHRLSFREYLQFARSDIVRVYAMKKAGVEIPEAQASRIGMAQDHFVRTVVAGARANEATAARYHMQSYPGAVTLFRTVEGPGLTGEKDATLGFCHVAAAVDVHTIAGNHLMLIREPYVVPLAQQLQACLDAIHTEAGAI
ncbi:MAG: amino acid adenylation domain-containing protein [Candidatus Hydrogenedentes bacterium]|nr:amino acid adenylation domain-containing protein [Candidatus Hydrogenedentota bacterium]